MSLNAAQLEAVQTLGGPLLVLAGAGTGKTRVVTYRIAELIRRGTRPERILAVTFTNKAAAEMQQRAAGRLGHSPRSKGPRPEISTFHSLCVRILRRHITRLGYPAGFAIYDRGDQESTARSVLREIKVADGMLRPGDLLYLIGRWKNSSVRPEQAAGRAASDREHLAAVAYRRYQKALKAAGAVDFDDLLLCTEDLFARFPAARGEEAARFDHLLVDEYQDTNGSQYRIVKALAGGHRNLCVVGDDDQSIYGWRGAEVAHILQFTKDWPEAKVVRLETNYRSTTEILRFANTLIAFNKLRHGKILRATFAGQRPRVLQLADEEEEARAVVEDIQSRLQNPERTRDKAKPQRLRPGDFAILFRTNEQPRPFEMALRRANIPYVLIGGMSFYDRKEVRDLLAYLKLLVRPRDDVALLRVINTPPRGLGQATVTRLVAEAVRRGVSMWDLLGGDAAAALAPAAASGIKGFRDLVERYQRRAPATPVPQLVEGLIAEVGYREEIARLYPTAAERQSRLGSVEEVINAAAAYARGTDKASLSGFLDDLTLSTRDDDKEKEEQLQRNAVALMTLHAAKGLEFPEVYVVGLEEGLLPHRRSIEDHPGAIDEERRLCYVGITRAQRRLTLTMARGRQKWGKSRPTIPSRFLYEMTGQADNPNYAAAIRQALPQRHQGTKRS